MIIIKTPTASFGDITSWSVRVNDKIGITGIDAETVGAIAILNMIGPDFDGIILTGSDGKSGDGICPTHGGICCSTKSSGGSRSVNKSTGRVVDFNAGVPETGTGGITSDGKTPSAGRNSDVAAKCLSSPAVGGGAIGKYSFTGKVGSARISVVGSRKR
jgi:hypothetical protein